MNLLKADSLPKKSRIRNFRLGIFHLLIAVSFLMLNETETEGVYDEKKKITVNRLCHSSDNWSIGYPVIYRIVN